jgi:hypothetical protein
MSVVHFNRSQINEGALQQNRAFTSLLVSKSAPLTPALSICAQTLEIVPFSKAALREGLDRSAMIAAIARRISSPSYYYRNLLWHIIFIFLLIMILKLASNCPAVCEDCATAMLRSAYRPVTFRERFPMTMPPPGQQLIVITRPKARRPILRATELDRSHVRERMMRVAGLHDQMTQLVIAAAEMAHLPNTRGTILLFAERLIAQRHLPPLDRLARRQKPALMCWFCENCFDLLHDPGHSCQLLATSVATVPAANPVPPPRPLTIPIIPHRPAPPPPPAPPQPDQGTGIHLGGFAEDRLTDWFWGYADRPEME